MFGEGRGRRRRGCSCWWVLVWGKNGKGEGEDKGRDSYMRA